MALLSINNVLPNSNFLDIDMLEMPYQAESIEKTQAVSNLSLPSLSESVNIGVS